MPSFLFFGGGKRDRERANAPAFQRLAKHAECRHLTGGAFHHGTRVDDANAPLAHGALGGLRELR